MKTVFIDPPFSPTKNWDRFGFSDIVWGYTGHNGIWNRSETFIASSYRTLPRFDSVQYLVIPASVHDIRNIVTSWLLYRRFAKEIKKLDPDVIHSPDYFSLAILSSFIPNALYVLTTPGSISERIATVNPYDKSYTMALKWARNRLRKLARTVILASSTYMYNWWVHDHFKNVKVIPLPVTTGEVVLREQAKTRLCWNSFFYHLLFVGALRDENNIRSALNLMTKLNNHRFHLHVIGDGKWMPLVKQFQRSGTPLTVHGPVSPKELLYFYSAADALLVPRRYNAVPRVALEALCCGTPIIANLNYSLRDFQDLDTYILQEDFNWFEPTKLELFLQQTSMLQHSIALKARSIFDRAIVAEQVFREIHEAWTERGAE